MFNILTRRALLIAACLAVPPTLAHAATKPAIKVENAWVRAAPVGATAGAAYMTLTNTGAAADRLVSGASTQATRVEVHEMSMDGGVMRMRPVDGGLAIPAGGTVALKAGGYHIMLIGLKGPLSAGGKLALTLNFEKAGAMRLTLPVQAAPK